MLPAHGQARPEAHGTPLPYTDSCAVPALRPRLARVVRGMRADALSHWGKQCNKLRPEYTAVVRGEQFRRLDRHWRHNSAVGGWRQGATRTRPMPCRTSSRAIFPRTAGCQRTGRCGNSRRLRRSKPSTLCACTPRQTRSADQALERWRVQGHDPGPAGRTAEDAQADDCPCNHEHCPHATGTDQLAADRRRRHDRGSRVPDHPDP